MSYVISLQLILEYNSWYTHSLQATPLWPCIHSAAGGERGCHADHSKTSVFLVWHNSDCAHPVSVYLALCWEMWLR